MLQLPMLLRTHCTALEPGEYVLTNLNYSMTSSTYAVSTLFSFSVLLWVETLDMIVLSAKIKQPNTLCKLFVSLSKIIAQHLSDGWDQFLSLSKQ